MKKTNQKGALDLMLVAAIVIVLGVGGFVLWRVTSADDTSSNAEDSSTSDANTENPSTDSEQDESESVDAEIGEYASEEFGFSLSYPTEWGKVTEDVTDHTDDGESAGGKFLTLKFENYDPGTSEKIGITISSATSEYFISKGPIPVSYLLNTGYLENEGQYYLSYDDDFSSSISGAKFNDESGAVYWVEPKDDLVVARDNYLYAFNTSVGGLVITTEDEAKLDMLAEIAESVEIL